MVTNHNTPTGFQGITVCSSKGSEGIMTKALTHLQYQQGQPPSEAGQVFEGVCVCDSDKLHGWITEAIVKVKYQ